MTVKFTTDAKVLSKSIKAWGKRQSAVINDLQTMAVSAICIAIVHGNVNPVNELDETCRRGVDGKGKTASGLHLSGLRKFFEDNGPVSFKRKDKEGKTNEHFAFSAEKRETLKASYDANPTGFRDNLMSKPYYHSVSQAEWQGFDLVAKMTGLLAQAKRIMSSDNPDKANHPNNDFTGLKDLEKIVAKLPKKASKVTA